MSLQAKTLITLAVLVVVLILVLHMAHAFR